MTNWFNKSAVSLTIPTLDGAPFSLTVRQDVVNAVIVALLPPEEFMVLLDYVVSLGMGERMEAPLLHHKNFLKQRGCKDPLYQRSPTFLAPRTVLYENLTPDDLKWGWGLAANTNEDSLTRPPFTPCCAAQFHGWGMGVVWKPLP